MRDLYCAHCASVLVENFWAMVEDETVRTFSSVTLTCGCGGVTQVDPQVRRRPERRTNVVPFALKLRAPMHRGTLQ